MGEWKCGTTILILGPRCNWEVSFKPQLFYRGKISRYPSDGMMDGSQIRCWRCGKETNLLFLPGIQHLYRDHGAHNLVNISTELSRLRIGYSRIQKCEITIDSSETTVARHRVAYNKRTGSICGYYSLNCRGITDFLPSLCLDANKYIFMRTTATWNVELWSHMPTCVISPVYSLCYCCTCYLTC
jgi:hypothetical protein